MSPELVASRPAARPASGTRGIGVTIISFNTAAQTLRCIESLRQSDEPPDWVFVLDNASDGADWACLRDGAAPMPGSELRIYRSEINLGFAAGSNFLIDELRREPRCGYFALLNNDAVALPAWTRRLADALDAAGERAGLAGARMHRLAAPAEVDTLGIALYSSLMPADRKSLADPLLGPTGGCCMLTRSCADELIAASGYFYDPRYFCYCEDTDLALRSVLLGRDPVYVDAVLALHEGQASTGRGYSPFITYHGIRNLVWMHWKLVPDALWPRHGLLLLFAHVLTIGRHVLSGRPALVWRLYRDAFARRGEFRAEHEAFRRHVRLPPEALRRRLAPRFYRSGYAGVVLAQLRQIWRP